LIRQEKTSVKRAIQGKDLFRKKASASREYLFIERRMIRQKKTNPLSEDLLNTRPSKQKDLSDKED